MFKKLLDLFRVDTHVTKRWCKGHLYHLHHVWVSVNGSKAVKRYAWYRDDGRKVSSYYRSAEMADINFGYFDPTENVWIDAPISEPTMKELREKVSEIRGGVN